jgi:flagellar biosynthesis GTPase FlhF
MGGLLAADIALVFRHRILGIVNFDVPFLGMHPGIIKAGLGSIFNTPPTPQDAIVEDPMAEKKPSRMSTIFNPKPSDPNYNPAFPNDVHLPVRKGWENSLHWLSKHYKDGLKEATKGLVKSHFEFGSAMADYRELKDRYAKVRALEEDDESKRKTGYPQMRSVPRIRFVNYYTASTGRPKKPKSPRSPSPKSPSSLRSDSLQLQRRDSDMSATASTTALGSIDQQLENQSITRIPSVSSSEGDMTHIHPEPMVDTPRASIEVQEHRDDGVQSVDTQESLSATSPAAAVPSRTPTGEQDGPPNLPEIPAIPQEPPFVDLMQFSDKGQRKAAEKEHDQALKVYQKAVKARNKMINERTKMHEKWEKDKAKERKEKEKEEKRRQEESEKQRKEQEKEDQRKQEEAKNISTEDPMRRKEREQRQAEAEQREAEARSRQQEADIRDGKIPPEVPPKPSPLPADVEEDLGAMQLGDDHPPQQPSNSPYANYAFSRSGIMSQDSPDSRADSSYTLSTMDSQNSRHPKRSDTGSSSTNADQKKPKKLGKFCMLPPKDSDGNKDPTWVQVFMQDMDEVTAHTSLFFVNETYERLVGDVGDRIEEWVREADSVRLVRDMEGLS